MNNALTTNVLIIGKSGVGKSSLLNYIFGSEVAETGAGRPITKKGIYPHTYKVNSAFHVNIYDTWGLEANKATKWKKIILDEINKHNCMNINEWFHTIMYCISAKSARIEDFEIAIIKELIESNNRVVIALTHCDVNNVDNAIKEARRMLTSIGVKGKDIIEICSVGKKLLSGKVTEPYGKNELMVCIKDNMWENIAIKLVAQLNEIGMKEITQWKNECKKYVDDKIKIYNFHSNKSFEVINAFCNNKLDELSKKISLDFEGKVTDALTYYNQISEKFALLNGEEFAKPYFDNKFKMHFSMEFSDKLKENLKNIIAFLIPIVGFKAPIVAINAKKDEIKKRIDSIGDDFGKDLYNKTDIIEDELLMGRCEC